MLQIARRSLMHGAIAGRLAANTADATVPDVKETGQRAKDKTILALARRVTMRAAPGQSKSDSAAAVTLHNGTAHTQHVTAFTGTPERPLARSWLRA